MSSPVDIAFTKALPKAELHAHLSGSISRQTLHEIWIKKRSSGHCLDLEDPLAAINAGGEGFIDVVTFFPLFDQYLYALVNDVESVRFATKRVLEEFEADGVRYLELRTTPRSCADTGMTAWQYVETVNELLLEWNDYRGEDLEAYLILSIDRRMTRNAAKDVLSMASKYHHSSNDRASVLGIDVCGNPTKGDVTQFTDIMLEAKDLALPLTVHFAEVPQSSTDKELSTILSWQPDRLGHCIHVSEQHLAVMRERSVALELCLSCNVLTKLTTGGYQNHHLKEWMNGPCSVALSTDDVGVFGSPLSNEYLLAAKHFRLAREDLVRLSRQAAAAAFGRKDRIERLIDGFEASLSPT